jgi:VanZ family protein
MLPSRFPRRVRLGLYALACAILLVLCALPSEDLPDPGTGDRFEHTAAWFVLTLTGFVLAPRRVLAIPAFALFYGLAIELLQGVLPSGRHSDPRDFVADVVGVAIACVLWFGVRRLAPRWAAAD